MNNKILIITAIKPDPLNGGGHPSGLIWEIINELKQNDIDIDIFIKKESNNRIINVIHRYGIYLKKISYTFKNYNKIVVYPENILLSIPKKYRSQAIVLGPDSPAIRDARIYKEMKKAKKRWWEVLLKGIYYNIAKYHEFRVLNQSKSFLVVGKTDAYWMKKNNYIKDKEALRKKIKVLTHPILSNVIRTKFFINLVNKRRFIFSGDLNYKFNNRFINELIIELNKVQDDYKNITLNIVVVGKKNKWIADLFNNINICKVSYISWIDNYNDVCIIGQDIHCLPLLVGAGTKNRTLTALANGLELISTPIGIENINYTRLKGIYITRDPKKFLEYILFLNGHILSDYDINELIKERISFKNKIDTKYKQDIKRLFM